VPFGDVGSDMLHGQAGLNRNAFLQLLGQEWLPKVPDVHDRLGSDPPARVAEIGCGAGWASIALARAYPRVSIDGFDLDYASIALAQANANATELRDRVRFTMQDASQVQGDGDYDLVLAFECIHDMADPVGALRIMRRLAAPGGVVIVMDERVGESFTARNEDTEWFMYGFSVLHCLPACMAEQPSAATGTVMRLDTFREYAQQAGFHEVEVLPIENFFYSFYRLTR
jgi:ubiquinone/menaquinone biosynthesis C-methylase UbiE